MTKQSSQQNNDGLIRQYLAHQQTMPYQATTVALPEPVTMLPSSSTSNNEPIITPPLSGILDAYSSQAASGIPEQPIPSPAKKRRRVVAIVLACMLGLGMYFIWHTSPSPTTTTMSTTQQKFSPTPIASAFKTGTASSPVTTSGKIQVYIVGAVKKPGVYTLEGNARIYNLLQAAGGPLPQANLVALNLATVLSDGQEIYVTRIGETPPTSANSALSTTPSTSTTTTTGGTPAQQININTASADDLRQGLHISSKNAQAIISYRVQHGSYTSVEELLQVVSQTTYKKIKNEVKLV